MKRQSVVPTTPALGPTEPDPAAADRGPALESDLLHLRALLERGDVEGARAWVSELERLWPDADEVKHYAQVLALPQVSLRPGHRGASRHRERAWLREHARRFSGNWLAVLGDQLIVADPDLNVVLAAARQTPGVQRPLLHFQPGTPD